MPGSARLTLISIFTCLSYPSFNLGVLMLILAAVVLLFYKTLGRHYYSFLYTKK